MKNLIKIFAMIAMVAFTATTVIAQEGAPRKGPNKEKMISKLNKELTLTADQQKKIGEIIDKFIPKFTGDKQTDRPLYAEMNKEIEKVLTPEQIAKKAELKEKAKAEMKQKKEGKQE